MTTTAPRPARLRLGAIVAAIVLPAIVVVVLVLLLTGGDDDAAQVSVYPGPKTLAASRDTTITLRGEEVDAANFRRDVRATGLLEDTGSLRSEGPGRPGRLYRRA